MVFKALIGGASGNLNTAPDSYGYFDDIIYVVNEAVARAYDIRTYRGNDLIDLRDSHVNNDNVVVAGAGNDRLLGGASGDEAYDQSGNDIFDMGAGNDFVMAGAGQDVMRGGAGVLDILSFNLFWTDLGASSANTEGVRCDLAKTGPQNFGRFGSDRVSGFEVLVGGSGADRFFGSARNEALNGQLGNDLLVGRGGADSLSGVLGADTLIGGAGGDLLDCSTLADLARDVIVFTRLSDSGRGTDFALVDRVSAFETGRDKIDLRALDAAPGVAGNQAFLFRGAGAFTSARGELRLQVIGSDTLVHVDVDGDAASEMNFWVMGATTLTAIDFLL